MINKRKKNYRGFTLIELLVVIAIVAILATVSVVGYTSFIKKANLSSDKEEVSQINRSLQYYMVHNSVDVSDPKAINEAVLMATDKKIDLTTFKLRSSKDGYNLWFNTDTLTFEVVKDYEDLVNEEKTIKAKELNKETTIPASASGFLWSSTTPYLLMSTSGNPLANLMGDLRSDKSEFNLKGISKDFQNELTKHAFLNQNGVVIDLDSKKAKSEVVLKDRLLFGDDVKEIKEVGNYEFNEISLPKSVNKIGAGALYDTKVKEVSLNSEVKVHTNAFNEKTLVKVNKDLDLTKTFTFQSKELKISQDDKLYTLTKDNLINDETKESVKTNVEVQDFSMVNKWKDEVKALSKTLNETYDLYANKDLIISLNETYNNFKTWEKAALEGSKAYDLFYKETVNSFNKPSFELTTGIYYRFNISNLISDLIYQSNAFKNSLNPLNIGKDNVNLLETFNQVLIDDGNYAISFSDSLNANSILFDNFFKTEVSGKIFVKASNGLFINKEMPGKGSIKVSLLSDLEKNITLEYVTENGISSISLASPKTNTRYFANGNEIVLGLSLSGKLDSPLSTFDFIVTINNEALEFELVVLNNLEYVLKIKKLNLKTNNDYVLKVSVKGLEVLIPFTLVEGLNIYDLTTFKKTFDKTNSVLNTSLKYNAGYEGYKIINGELYYLSTINEATSSMTITNATFYGNDLSIDASLVTSTKSAGNMYLMMANNAVIRNVKVLLAEPVSYNPSAPFNEGAASIWSNGGLEVYDSTFTGGARGLRFRPNNTKITRVTFNKVMVPLEVYADGSGPTVKSSAIISDVIINSHIRDNGKVQNGMGIVYFPGGGGKGIRNFHNIDLTVENLSYDGVFDSKGLTSLLQDIVGGLTDGIGSSVIEVLVGSIKGEVDKLFKENNITTLSPNIIIPNELYVRALGKDVIENSKFNDFPNYKINLPLNYKSMSFNSGVNLGLASAKYGFSVFFDTEVI